MIPRLGSRDGFSRQYSLDRRDRHIDDVAEVGGRNALLGELYLVLSAQGVNVPNGFAYGRRIPGGADRSRSNIQELMQAVPCA